MILCKTQQVVADGELYKEIQTYTLGAYMTYIINVTGYGLRLSYKIVGNEAVLEALDMFNNDCKKHGFKVPSKWWDFVDGLTLQVEIYSYARN